MSDVIPFHRPYITGQELTYLADACAQEKLSGDGPFTKRCHGWLETQTRSQKALLTHSATAALEMAALLLDLTPGDEVIMPSYTFVSTANAFVLRGAVPVFIDIRPDTLNMDETLIEAAITPKTRALAPVHYAGVSCEMDTIMTLAQKYNLSVVEDAAQGLMASYKGRPLGSIGDLGVFSFHETKNVISGEGGSLLVNKSQLIEKAEIIREKGTNRSSYFRGEVDKYTWQEMGSSYLPGELIAAFLWAQLEKAQEITAERLKLWAFYQELLKPLEEEGLLRRPVIPDECCHNAHIYYVVLSPKFDRQHVLEQLKIHGIQAVSHYVPLHSSPAGKRYGRPHGLLSYTNTLSEQLMRLPLWIGMTGSQQEKVVEFLKGSLRKAIKSSSE